MLYNEQQQTCIDIYDHDNLHTAKRVIQLPLYVWNPSKLVACSITNCLYILHQGGTPGCIEILRALLDETWITSSIQYFSTMSISADGSLILFQSPFRPPSTIKVYNTGGSLQHQMVLANHISHIESVLGKSNGNFVLVTRECSREMDGESLREVDRQGNTLYTYSRPYYSQHICCAIDIHDRIVTIDDGGHVFVLDSGFNSVGVTYGLDPGYRSLSLLYYEVHYNVRRNEFVAFERCGVGGGGHSLTVFSFTERKKSSKWCSE